MRIIILLIVSMVLSPALWASCVTIDTAGWPQNKKNMRQSLAYRIAFNNSGGEKPTVINEDICFPTFNPTPLITQSSMETLYQSHIADNAAVEAAGIQQSIVLLAEVSSNQVCQAKLSTIDSAIDGLSTVAELKGFLKKLARCFVASRELKGEQ